MHGTPQEMSNKPSLAKLGLLPQAAIICFVSGCQSGLPLWGGRFLLGQSPQFPETSTLQAAAVLCDSPEG